MQSLVIPLSSQALRGAARLPQLPHPVRGDAGAARSLRKRHHVHAVAQQRPAVAPPHARTARHDTALAAQLLHSRGAEAHFDLISFHLVLICARAHGKTPNSISPSPTPPAGPLSELSDAQLDFYSCLNELDAAVGRVLASLDRHDYGHNTLTWLATECAYAHRKAHAHAHASASPACGSPHRAPAAAPPLAA